MADFEIEDGLRFVDRSGWTPNPTLPRLGGIVPRSDRTHVIIHHTVTPDADTTPNIWETDNSIFNRMRRLQVARPDLGLDVPYSFVAFIHPSGLVICEGRGEDRTGAHTKGHNTAGIGISFAGDFENNGIAPNIIADRIPLLSAFLRWLRTSASHPDYGEFPPMPNLGSLRPSSRQVFAHQDFKSTDCPGAQIKPHLDEVDFL